MLALLLSLKIYLDQLGPHHIRVATTYNNIGRVLHKQGEYKQAISFYKKALKIRLDQLGPHHISVATTYNNIEAVLDDQGKHHKAK